MSAPAAIAAAAGLAAALLVELDEGRAEPPRWGLLAAALAALCLAAWIVGRARERKPPPRGK